MNLPTLHLVEMKGGGGADSGTPAILEWACPTIRSSASMITGVGMALETSTAVITVTSEFTSRFGAPPLEPGQGHPLKQR